MRATVKRSVLSVSAWSPRRWAALIFVLALALRLGHLVEIRDLVYTQSPVLDTEEYAHLAASLLEGRWRQAADGTYVHGIVYPALWALVELAGGGPGALRVLQALLGALGCVLLYDLGRRLLPHPAALLGGTVAACYWPLIVYDGQLVATGLVVFLLVVLVWHLARTGDRPAWTALAVAGVVAGLLAGTRANAALMAPMVLAWVAVRPAASRRLRWQLAAAFTGGLLVVLVPVAALNQSAQGTPVPFQGAWSLYLGTNPEADGTPYVRQGIGWQRLEILGFRDGPGTTRAARGAVYLEESLRFVRQEPLRYAGLLYAKLRLFWHAYEVPVSVDLRYLEASSRLFPLLPVGFGVVAPLALVGLVAVRRHWRDWLLPLGAVGAFLVSGLLFTVCARYRLPAVPFLILLAAAGLHRGWQAVAAGDRRRTLTLAGLLVAAGAVVHTGVDAAAVDHVRSPWLLGQAHLRRGDLAAGAAAYDEAARRYPEDADVLNSVGAVRERRGDRAGAEQAYRQSLEAAPDHSRARVNLGRLLRSSGRQSEARAQALQVLARDPRPGMQHEARVELAGLAVDRGDLPAAARAFAQALQVQDRALTRYALAGVLHRLGRVDLEIAQLERAVQLQPTLAAAHRNLGALYLQQGDAAAAEAALLQAIRLQPEVGLAHANLAALYERTGRPDLARTHRQRAAQLGAGGGPEPPPDAGGAWADR